MPRLARLDAPGVIHHVMIHGIEHRKIFSNNKERNDMLDSFMGHRFTQMNTDYYL